MGRKEDREEQRIDGQRDGDTRAQKNKSTRNPIKVTTTRTRTKSYDEYTDGFTDEDKRETAGQALKDHQGVNNRVARGFQFNGGQEGYGGNHSDYKILRLSKNPEERLNKKRKMHSTGAGGRRTPPPLTKTTI